MSQLYQRIQQLCQQRNISTYRLCADIGLSRGVISDLKYGRKRTLSAESLQRIAAYFGVPIEELLAGGAGAAPAPPGGTAAPDDELAQYLEELRTRPELRAYFSLAKNATKQDVQDAMRIVEAFLQGRQKRNSEDQ